MIGLLIRLFKKNFKMTSSDERIEKETNSILIQGYFIAQVIALIVLGYTLICKAPIINLIVPLGVLLICNTYIFIKIKQYSCKIKDFIYGTDEFFITIRNKTFKEGYFIGFYFVMFINLFFIGFIIYEARSGFTLKNNINFIINYAYSFMIIMISSLYITIKSVRKGLLSNISYSLYVEDNNQLNTKKGLKKFKIKCVLGAIFFGIILGLSSKGHFTLIKFFKIAILSGGFWGFSFYYSILGIMKLSSKKANKRAND